MTKQAKFDFEQVYKELETIVDKFENGSIDLGEGLKEFERGLELAALLKKHLMAIENKVVEIKKKFSEDAND